MRKDPLSLYKERLASGILKRDPGQEKAVAVLQSLYVRLMEIHKRKSSNILERMTGLARRGAEAPKGVYMHGGVGRGKSMLMDLFYECLPDDMRKTRVHFHAFMIDVHNYLHERRENDDFGEGIDGALPSLASRIAERSRVLCFDEFHVTDVADAMILGRLFTALFDRGVIVVATSNWPPDRLYEGGLQRDRFLSFINLLNKKLEIVHLDGAVDYRAQFLQSEGTYFWPLGEMTRRRADDVFARLTDHAVPYAEELTVKGRAIPVPVVAKGAARFTFSDLCEKPHGAEDYLAIAARYSVVFLEEIPKMAYDRRNEAKRLMTLIDALYESGTHLIITADAPPDRLYYGHDHAFEFQRTVSRLLEMQSDQYLN